VISAGRKPESEDLRRVGPGVQQQITAGHADVEGSRADVDGDVARAQEEELDVVRRVAQHEVPGVGALAIARITEQGHRRGRERALVRDGDAQRGHGRKRPTSRLTSPTSRLSEVPVDVVEGEAAAE
jgi:hypothetical protein